jgi:hypothetical protein
MFSTKTSEEAEAALAESARSSDAETCNLTPVSPPPDPQFIER